MPDSAFTHLPDVWQKVLELYLDQIEGISGSTESRRNYSYRLAAFFSVPGKPCDAYTRADVIEWLNSPNSLRSHRNPGQPVGPAGYNARLMTLVSFYKFVASYYCEDGDTLLSSKRPPTWGVKYRKTGKVCRSLSEAELERFFAAIGDGTSVKSARDFAIFCAYFYTGRRRQELCNIRWKDFTETTFIEENGQERRGIQYRYRAKGKSRIDQYSEMPGPAWDAILHYLRLSDRLETIQPDDPIFVSVESGHPHKDDDNPSLNGHYLNTLFRLICRKANIDTSRGLTLHSMRHSAALMRLRTGCTLESIRKFLGHSSIAITARYCETIQTPGDSDAARLEKRLPFLSRRPGGVAR